LEIIKEPFMKLFRVLGAFLGKVTKFSFITVLVVVVLIVSLLPFVIRWQAVNWLEQQGLEAEIGYISIRPILGSVQINDVRIEKTDTEQLLIDELQLNIDWMPLLDKEVYVEHVVIDGLSVDVVQSDSGLRIGGISLPTQETEEDLAQASEKDGSAAEPPLSRIRLEKLVLENIKLCYSQVDKQIGKQADKQTGMQVDKTDAAIISQCAAFKELSLIDELDIHLGDAPSAEIGGVLLEGFHWKDVKKSLELLGIDRVKIEEIASPDLSAWQVVNLSVESLGVLPVREDEELVSGDFRLSSLSLSDLEIGSDNSIGEVLLSGLYLDLNLNGHAEPIFSPRLMASLEPLMTEAQGSSQGSNKGSSQDKNQTLVKDEKTTEPNGTDLHNKLSVGKVSLDQLSVTEGNHSRTLLTLNDFNLQKLSQNGSDVALVDLKLSGLNLLPTNDGEGDLELSKLSLTGLSVGKDNSIEKIALGEIKAALRSGEQGELAFAPALIKKLGQLSAVSPEDSKDDKNSDSSQSIGHEPSGSEHSGLEEKSPPFALKQLGIDSLAVRDGDNNQSLLSFHHVDLKQLSVLGSDVSLGHFQMSDLILLPTAVSTAQKNDQPRGDFVLEKITLTDSVFGDASRIGGLSLSGIHVGLETKENGQLAFAPELLDRLPKGEGSGGESSSAENAQKETSFAIDQLMVNGTLVRDKVNQRDLMKLKQINLSGLETQGEAIDLEKLRVESLKLMEPRHEDTVKADYYFKTPNIELTGIKKSIQIFSLKELIVADPEAFIHRNSSGQFQALSEIEQMVSGDGAAHESSTADIQADSSSSPVVHYSVGRIKIGSEGLLSVLDESVSPVFKRNFNELSLVVDNIDSSSPEAISTLSFNLGLTKFGYIKFDGTLSPFGEKLTTDIVGELRGLDARALSTYASDYIGYSLDQGIAEADVNFDVNEDNLNAAITTRFRKLEVSALNGNELPEGAESLGMPLDFALNLLRDKNGMIELKLPITGDIHSPDFSLSNIVGKVMFKVISETIVNYYLPFGLIMAATMQDTLSNFSFDPVVFTPGETELDAGAAASLDKLSAMLNSREQLHLSFCAPSTWQDWSVKFAPSAASEQQADKTAEDEAQKEDSSQIGESPAEPVVTAEQVDALKAIADQRSDAVKQYLIDKGVKTGQVILCEDQFDQTNKGLPQMNIAI
jgi:hypothetical protein